MTTIRRGCELAPSKAPEGLELATFAGKDNVFSLKSGWFQSMSLETA